MVLYGFQSTDPGSLFSHALEDKVILVGRGGNFLLRDVSYVLRVRITAPLEVRVERMMRKEEISRETAEWLIEKTDSDSSCYINSMYGRRWDDRAEYDLVFDTSVQSVEAIVKSLKDALLDKERFNTDEARILLRARAQAAKVKAGLLSSGFVCRTPDSVSVGTLQSRVLSLAERVRFR